MLRRLLEYRRGSLGFPVGFDNGCFIVHGRAGPLVDGVDRSTHEDGEPF